MKLSPLHMQILRFIESKYSLTVEKDIGDKIKTRSEKPLPTLPDLCDYFKKYDHFDIQDAAKTLVSHAFIVSVYLYHENDFDEFHGEPGKTFRQLPINRVGTGVNGYQMTQHGVDQLNNSLRKKFLGYVKIPLGELGKLFAVSAFTFLAGLFAGSSCIPHKINTAQQDNKPQSVPTK
jgi:hypothetical protein